MTTKSGSPDSSTLSAVSSRRIWVRRPGQVATTVSALDTEIIDDLKTAILMKFPTSLGKTCDPVDLLIRYTPKPNNGKSPKIPQNTSQTAIFTPDETIGNIFMNLFPNGMTMEDAFIVEINRPSSPKQVSEASTPPSKEQEKKASSMTKSPPMTKPPSINGNTVIEDEAAKKELTKEKKEKLDKTPVSNGSIKTGETPINQIQEDSRSSTSSPSLKRSRGFSHSGNNGVLLLPRQFQLTQAKGKEEEDQNLSIKPFINAEPSPISSTSINAPELASSLTVSNTEAESASSQKSKSKKTTNGLSLKEGFAPKITVLIVEDNFINRSILEERMKMKHIRCEIANNGKEAVEKWRQGGFHLVLMDIQLPVMSGIQATKEIRRLEHDNLVGALSPEEKKAIKAKVIPEEDKLDTKLFKSPVIIVALTASSSSEAKSEALAAGCNDFLTKPVSLSWLEQKTIEWGCMQALIDFEGWKNWVTRNGSNLKRSTSTSRSIKRRSRSRGRPRGRSKAGETTAPTLTSADGNELVSPLTTGPTV